MLKKVIISICTTIVLSIVGVASVVDVRNKEVNSSINIEKKKRKETNPIRIVEANLTGR